MDKKELIDQLMDMFMRIKNTQFHNIIKLNEMCHNEKLVLFLIHKEAVDHKVSLSLLREKINLAPSTVTPIITSLERKGLIERNIDLSDRRNIYLQLSQKGIELTKDAHEKMLENLHEYVDFMGMEDTSELIRLLTKTSQYLKERKEK